MVSVLLAALLTAAPSAGTAGSSEHDAALDLRCFQLMAELAESEDPRVRTTGRVAAQYFLGRIDAASPGAELNSPPPADPEAQDALLGRCSAAMEAGGHDFRAIGEELTPGSRPAA